MADAGQRLPSSIAPNLLEQQFEAMAPNQRWVADFTFIMTAQLVPDVLVMAVWRRAKPEPLLHHSDQGNQFASEHFQRLLADRGITRSMCGAGDVWDNTAMESFSSSLKIGRMNRRVPDYPFHDRAIRVT
jgi:putative transposase